MKKTYNVPTLEVVKIETQQMIAESIAVNGSYNGSATIESRGGSDWDDDED